MKRIKENKYFHLGILILSVVTIGIVMLAVVLNLEAVGKIFKTIGNVLSPLVVGFVLAYLMNPLMNFLDRRLRPLLVKKMKKEEKAVRLSRVCSLIFAVAVFGFLVYEFCALLLPQLYESILGIVNNFSAYYSVVEGWVMAFLADNPVMQEYARTLMSEFVTFLTNWANTGLLPSLEAIVNGLTSSVMSVIGAALDLLIGLCAAVYMLWGRDTFLAQSKKCIVALCKPRAADHLLDLGRRIHKVFSGFIIGKIVDSMIIGVLCYIGVLILKMPYPALIATVVGVTNVIPFFGPSSAPFPAPS